MINKDYFTQLTSNLYRLTLLFPKKDPLRYKMRGVADEVLANLVSLPHSNSTKSKNLVSRIKKDLEVLDSFFGVAKNQNWVKTADILGVQEEYSKIKEEIERFEESGKVISIPEKESLINERQQKILDILKEKKKIQIGELVEVFPEVSKRTLIRDLEDLMYRAFVLREGSGRGVSYSIIET